jgi:hypothetical protein
VEKKREQQDGLDIQSGWTMRGKRGGRSVSFGNARMYLG